MTTTIIKAHQVPSPRGGKRARAAWTPTPGATPIDAMRTALVRLDAITTLLTRERIAHRMEAVLAQTSPEALVEAYTVDLLNANPRIENECGTLIYTYWEMHQAIGEWPTPRTIAEFSLDAADGRIRARDVVGDRGAPGGRLFYGRWPLPIYPIVLDVLLDGVGEGPVGLKETSPERLAEAAPEAEALLHRLPQLAGVPLAEMGSAGARISERARLAAAAA
ncbi:hypothetical protein [Nocardiopsis composta]|uniref:Uncharacterized protein n=1 Tax=Nocardiopsis composta TaxID=157465 RepID=A0A7W8VH74_9ACTN|nr:hypothetical protein [Nocardiopsis composta]MBB5436317.1 hypothetical protein [Nocardiopsis composta]